MGTTSQQAQPIWSAAACRRCLPSRLAGTCCTHSHTPNESANATSTASRLAAEFTAYSNDDSSSAGEASLACNTAAALRLRSGQASRRTPHGAESYAAQINPFCRRKLSRPPPTPNLALIPMPICVALVQSRASAAIWDRCTYRALRGDRFCADHRHALDGAVMGFLDTKEYRHAQEKYRHKARRQAIRNAKKKPRRRPRTKTKDESLAAGKLRDPRTALEDFFRPDEAP